MKGAGREKRGQRKLRAWGWWCTIYWLGTLERLVEGVIEKRGEVAIDPGAMTGVGAGRGGVQGEEYRTLFRGGAGG